MLRARVCCATQNHPLHHPHKRCDHTDSMTKVNQWCLDKNRCFGSCSFSVSCIAEQWRELFHQLQKLLFVYFSEVQLASTILWVYDQSPLSIHRCLATKYSQRRYIFDPHKCFHKGEVLLLVLHTIKTSISINRVLGNANLV
ncbi:MAG: hypothetical protein CM15mP59_1280 [Flavobacteriaceae bacterium]|nr:MAG: hypothetical protein CM15mP59_1280 [Flavobacteriaceae bacterium]